MIANLLGFHCCKPDCKHAQKLSALHIDDELPNIPTEFVHFKCTKCIETTMCITCFDQTEHVLLKFLRAERLSAAEKKKAVWTTKYEMIMRHPDCKCSCGGTLQAKTSGRDVITLDGSPTTEKRSKNRSGGRGARFNATATAHQRKTLDFGQENDEELDEEQKLHMYTRTEEESTHKTAPEVVLPEMTSTEVFPSLKPTQPSVVNACVVRRQVPKSLPSIECKKHSGFHTITVTGKSHKWPALLIGRQGTNINELRQKHKVQSITIHDSADNTKRIVISGDRADEREICMYAVKARIERIISRV